LLAVYKAINKDLLTRKLSKNFRLGQTATAWDKKNKHNEQENSQKNTTSLFLTHSLSYLHVSFTISTLLIKSGNHRRSYQNSNFVLHYFHYFAWHINLNEGYSKKNCCSEQMSSLELCYFGSPMTVLFRTTLTQMISVNHALCIAHAVSN